VTVIETVEDAEGWIEGPGREAARVGVLCQTTISEGLMNSVVSLLRSRLPEVEVRNTLCESVVRRQREAVSLSKRVDVVLVVGGRNSSNTAHLARICSDAGVPTHQVEEPTEIRAEWLAGVGSVGVVGGASTPSWLIDEAVDRLVELGGTR
jgi:4-hydroxy-3-methylbut-2-enyl diphosphate reductase